MGLKAPAETINEAIKALDDKSYAKNNNIEVKEMPF